MKRFFITLFCTICYGINTTSAQSKTETIDMDLYFHYFDVFQFYDMEPKKLKKLERYMSKFKLEKAGDDTLLIVEFRKAIKDSLIRQPYIYVKNDTMDYHLFLAKSDYEKFIGYDFDTLEKEHQKVRINAEVKEVEYFGQKSYRCLKLMSVTKTDGKTYNNKTHTYEHGDYLAPNDTLK